MEALFLCVNGYAQNGHVYYCKHFFTLQKPKHGHGIVDLYLKFIASDIKFDKDWPHLTP